MKGAAAVGVGVAVLGSRRPGASVDRPLERPAVQCGALRPPMPAGGVWMVTYSVPPGMTQAQALALLSFVAAWGTPTGVPEFSSTRAGEPTVSVTARVEVAQPKGPPTIPSPAGNLVPMVWGEASEPGSAAA